MKNIRLSKEQAIELLRENGEYIKYFAGDFLDDYDIINEALKTYPGALRYASERLQDDIGIVISALIKDRNVIRYASDRLYSNKALNTANEDTLKHWLKVCKDPENFDLLDNDFFIRENRRYLEFAVQIIKDKLKALPENEVNKEYIEYIIKFIKETIAKRKMEIKQERKQAKIQKNREREFERNFDELLK